MSLHLILLIPTLTTNIDGFGAGTRYNLGMLDQITGIATVPSTGRWQSNITYEVSNPLDAASSITAVRGNLDIIGVGTAAIIAQDDLEAASDVRFGNSVNMFLTAGQQLTYTLTILNTRSGTLPASGVLLWNFNPIAQIVHIRIPKITRMIYTSLLVVTWS